MADKTYDRRYFDRWYRHPRGKVTTVSELRRTVAVPISIAEHVLGRRLRSVLDVGCGEAPWRSAVRRYRPGARYVGVDPSDYVVRRFGRARNVRRGSFADLRALPFRGRFDLIVCSDVAHYLGERDLRQGLSQMVELLGGVAYIAVQTSADGFTGDRRDWRRRSPRWYADAFRDAGLTPAGMQCYVGPEIRDALSALEAAPTGRRRRR